MELPQRKLQRLKNYDYSQNYAYFITICTQNKLHLFGKVENSEMTLNQAGIMISDKFIEMSLFYKGIIIDKHVIMPNHMHAIIILQNDGLIKCETKHGQLPTTKTLSDYIQRYKSLTTKLYIDGVKKGLFMPFDGKVWQKSFHDHIIRNEIDYQGIWEYIDKNPLRWDLDKYYL